MAYATTADVQRFLDGVGLTIATTKTSEADVTAWITASEARLNGALQKAGYATVPADAAADIAILADVTAQYVAARVFADNYVTGDEFPAIVTLWLGEYKQFLADIGNGINRLTAQTPTQRTLRMIAPKVYGAD